MNPIIASIKRRIFRAVMTLARPRSVLVGPPELWEMKRRFQIDFLRRSGLQPHHYLFSIGCGVLRGGIPNIDYLDAGHYYGIDARAYALEEARRELQEAGLAYKKPELVLGEYLANLSFGRQFDYIWAFSVLIHMSDPILAEAIQFVANHLKPDGVFYGNVDTANRSDGWWQEFPHVHRPIGFYQEVCERNGLELTDVGTLSDLGHISGDPGDENRMLKIQKQR
jgi:SAM-dependent methyltransferase